MELTVTDVLTNEVIIEFSNNAGWSENLRNFLQDISNPLVIDIIMKYSGLKANTLYQTIQDDYIAYLLYNKLSNEIERIYSALTIQYTPKYNYYRKIGEKNSGADNHIYGGQDASSLSGSDTTSNIDDLDIDNNIIKDNSKISNTTYDSSDDNGFRPVSKQENEYNDHSDYVEQFVSTMEYGKTDTMYYGKTLKMQYGRNVSTEIEGNNGIYPFPDLIKKEYDLRMKHKLFETIESLIVREVSAGVWITDD